jgi:hypothetical protein
VTHYACPVPGCNSKEKRARPAVKIPVFPQPCPQRTCRNEHGKPLAFLEVDARLSGVSHLRMVCPKCRFHVNVPRPQFGAAVPTPAEAKERYRRGRTEDLASR